VESVVMESMGGCEDGEGSEEEGEEDEL